MSGNSFGKNFTVTTFGESHGEALGCIIDGIESGIKLDLEKIQKALDRRRPGSSFDGTSNACVTDRKEEDKFEILSGLFNGFTTGTPLTLIIRNTNQHSSDYSEISSKMRPGHADFTYLEKYGIRDYRGGGRSSGRETCARVAAGEIARQYVEYKIKNSSFKNCCSSSKNNSHSDNNITSDSESISVTAYTLRAAGISCEKIDFSEIEKNPLRAPDSKAALLMQNKIEELRKQGNSAGGIIECQISNLPAGIGNPVFDKLDAMLAHAVLSIGAVKGIEFGKGFEAADITGSENNDQMTIKDKKPFFLSNNAGGILGGISNGNTIVFRAAVKPVPSIFTEQKTVSADINPDEPVNAGSSSDGFCNSNPKGIQFKETEIKIKGRHDVCLAPRIVPVIEAMTWIVLADLI
ncbi:MAG: chorismate synthase [Treponema sp.]|nr:chorismate synthase [Candidatus Treponema merdequi]